MKIIQLYKLFNDLFLTLLVVYQLFKGILIKIVDAI